MKEILTQLTSLPHRGSTTGNEQTAAKIIEHYLTEFGYETQKDTFQSPTTYSWEVVVFALLVSGGLLVALISPAMGAVLCVVGLWSFVRHFDGQDTPLGKVIPKKFSQNILGTMNEKAKQKVVYLMAHYDTTRASHLFHPAMVKNFRSSFLLSTTVIFIAPLVAFSGIWLGQSAGFHTLIWIMAFYIAFQILMLIHREWRHNYINGANDNGSGVTAILALAEYFSRHPLSDTTLKIVATGCEEVGLYGARAFVKNYKGLLIRKNTYVLNFDSVGKGDLHYCIGEGMLGFHHYDPELITIAEQLALNKFPDVTPHCYTKAQFDTLILVHKNIKSLSFIALDNHGLIPNWHWYTDTLKNIEWTTLQKAVDFGIALIRTIDRSD